MAEAAALYPVTVKQVSNDLETALVEWEQARQTAEDAIRACEVRTDFENAGTLERAMSKLEDAYARMADMVAILVTDAKRCKVVLGILKRHVEKLGI